MGQDQKKNARFQIAPRFRVNLFRILSKELLGRTLTNKSNANRTLDCLGLFCPEPVFRTRVELDKMNIGETLEIWADDPAAERDIQSLTQRLGHKILKMKKDGDKLYFLIRKEK